MSARAAPARRIPPRLAIVGAAAVLIALAVMLIGSQQLYVSYLFAYLFVLGIALGSLAVLMLHDLTGGPWADAIRPALLSATGTLPLLALLFVPVLVGLHQLYPWSVPPHDAVIQAKRWFLNAPFFVVRAVVYFAVWLALAHRLRRLEAGRRDRPTALLRFSAAGLIVYGITVTLAAVDWLMSLTPRWYSTTFGLLVGIGQMLAALAFGIVVSTWGAQPDPARPGRGRPDAGRLHDLGNLLLTFVMTWAYLAFTQYLIIWIENLPSEIGWYVPRVQTSWRALGWILVLAHFAVPFCVLLGRRAKRSTLVLGAVAAGLLLAHLADLFWLVAPTFRPGGFALHLTDLVAVCCVIGVWIAAMPGRPGEPVARPVAAARRERA